MFACRLTPAGGTAAYWTAADLSRPLQPPHTVGGRIHGRPTGRFAAVRSIWRPRDSNRPAGSISRSFNFTSAGAVRRAADFGCAEEAVVAESAATAGPPAQRLPRGRSSKK
ncbi:hypothetical protein FMEAI12_3090031 [Parafrankia sp. Ea1.12]|nr:hypothetical protein FMEAI12_3090031 [Parafrankia sp. Ea1.12]